MLVMYHIGGGGGTAKKVCPGNNGTSPCGEQGFSPCGPKHASSSAEQFYSIAEDTERLPITRPPTVLPDGTAVYTIPMLYAPGPAGPWSIWNANIR